MLTFNLIDGKVEIEMPDDDPDAFAVWLNIIHLRFRRVPVKMSIPLLSSFVMLIDKLLVQLEPIEERYDAWLNEFEKQLLSPEAMDAPTLVQAISIAWASR